MTEYEFTDYFENEALRKRSYIPYIICFQIGDLKYEAKLLPRYRFFIYRVIKKNSVESQEISEGVVIDYDSEGNTVGIDIDNASKKINLSELVVTKMPVVSQMIFA